MWQLWLQEGKVVEEKVTKESIGDDDDVMYGENDEGYIKFFNALKRALTKQRQEKM